MADGWENGEEGGGSSMLSPSSLGGLKSTGASRMPTYAKAGDVRDKVAIAGARVQFLVGWEG